ncbi:MAG: hypothetical protein DMF06_09975 [Verrucomicrobia bacterium]|jgi:hypothetical protein|nr:MAG: hypothetical protein DMF06_09975 [Verrucomicrobiota bacterium]
MKPILLTALFLSSIASLTYSDTIPVGGPPAGPGVKEAFEKFNADVAAWNRRCTTTSSAAEQTWCEEQRALLESRKAKLRAGAYPTADEARNPTVQITLRRRGGQIVKQVQSDANGFFTVGTFPAGAYTLDFRAQSVSAVKDRSFVIKIAGTNSRGADKVLQGRYFADGVSFGIETLSGAPLKGVIAPSLVRNAKKMIWLPPEIGTNLPGRWIEEGSAQAVGAHNWGHYTVDAIRKMQDHNDY